MRFIKNYNRMLSLCMVACGLWMCVASAFAYTAQFHAGAGLVNGKSSDAISEASDGAGIVMPTPTLAGCEGWEFAGWIASGVPYEPSDELTQEIYPAGIVIHLTSVSEEFYAVYRHVTDRYCEIYVNDQLRSGAQYVAVNTYRHAFLYPNSDGLYGYYVESYYNTWSNGYIDIDAPISALDPDIRASMPHIITETNATNHYWALYNPHTEYYINFSPLGGLASYNASVDCNIARTGWNTFSFSGVLSGSPIGFNVSSTWYTDFNIYRQQTFYTSNPDCSGSNYTVTFDPGSNGTCATASLTESGYHYGVVLPAATPNTGGGACNALWEFAGWTESGSMLGTDSAGLAKRLWLQGEVYYPERDETLHAVYRRKSTTWEQVEDPNTLQAGEKILIAYNNGDGYYMLSSAAYSTGYNAAASEGVEEITSASTAAWVWTLEGTKNAWRLKDNNGKHLDMTRSDYAYSYTYPWSRWSDDFTIAGETNLSIRSNYADKHYLKANSTKFLSQAAATSNIHIYRQVTTYSKTPRCETYTVLFNSGEGTFGSGSIKDSTVAISGISSSTGILLSNASIPVAHAPACEEWKFAGWRVGSGLHSTTEAPGVLYKTTDTYIPMQDSITLYAVYQNGDGGEYYQRITSSSEIVNGGTYIIGGYSDDEGYAISHSCRDKAKSSWYLSSISPVDGRITTAATNILWTFNGTYFVGNNKPLAYNQNTSYYFYVDNSESATSPFYLREHGYSSYHLYTDSENGYTFEDNDEDLHWYNAKFYIYKQHTSVAEYNSWPHCTAFTVVLNAGGGKFAGSKDTIHVTEPVAGDGISLSGKTPTTECGGWSLVGWVADKAVQARKSAPTGMLSKSANYTPKETPDYLYAVYSNGSLWSSYPACGEGVEIVEWLTDGIIVESYTLIGTPTVNGHPGTANGDGTYTLTYDVKNNPCAPILIEWDGVDQIFQTPMIVDHYTRTSAVTSGIASCSTCDIVVLNGGTAVADQTTTVHDIMVYPGGRFNLASGKSFTANSLTMRTEGDDLAPLALIQGTFTCTNLYHERRIDNARKYWMALPYDVTIANINFANPTANAKNAVYDRDFYLQYYDGVSRAADKGAKGSYWVHIGDITDETYQAKTTLNAGRGYLVSLPRSKQASTGHVHRTLRFPMTVASWTTESSINKTVVAAGADCDWPQHVGWNLIGNPFLQNYSAVSANDVQCGQLTKFYNDQDQWVEPWYELEEGTTAVPYITLYDPATGEYTQKELVGQNIHPFSAAFVQLPSGVSGLHFAGTAISKNSAPARRMGLMNSSDETSRFRIMANGKESDQFTLILNDQYTAAYEVGSDLMKMKNENKLNIYTIHEGTEQAFDALSYADGEMIPVGFTQPAAGGIIIQARKLQQGKDIKHLWLIDNETNAWTDLLSDSYVFTSEAGTYNGRLWLRIEKENKITTPITEIGINETDQARKFMYDGQLFIHRGDKLYNAVGTLVK